jgi:hypothetical protein
VHLHIHTSIDCTPVFPRPQYHSTTPHRPPCAAMISPPRGRSWIVPLRPTQDFGRRVNCWTDWMPVRHQHIPISSLWRSLCYTRAMRWVRIMRRGMGSLFFGSLLVMGLASRYEDALPPLAHIDPLVSQAPLQTPVTMPPLSHDYDGQRYLITPRYDYEMTGLIVSQNDRQASWLDPYYDMDPFNIKDLCLLYGGSVVSGAYRLAQFHSQGFMCFFRYAPGVSLNPDDVANNHLLPANADVARRLTSVRPGDQVFLRGQLVDYTVEGMGTRHTSISRNDRGNGACEVLYLRELRVIRTANIVWRMFFQIGVVGAVLAVLLWIYLHVLHAFFFNPYRGMEHWDR